MKNATLSILLIFLVLTAKAQWVTNYQTPFQQMVKVMSAADDNNCWFISNMDSLFKTNDGGTTWTKTIQSNASFNPSGIFVMDGLVAFKWGNGNVYKTINGGTSWTPVFTGGVAVSPSLWMKDSTNGVLAYNGQLYLSTDGGDTWSLNGITQPPLTLASTTGRGNIYVSGDSLWVALHNGGVAFSPDFGQTWNNSANTGLSFSGYGSISFSNSNFGIAIRQNSPYIYVTTDQAQSWIQSTNTLGANESVLAYGSELWFIPNPADHFYIGYSADSGASWTQQLFDQNGFDVLEKSRIGSTIWAGTEKGKVYKYTISNSTGTTNTNFVNHMLKIYPNPSADYFTCMLNSMEKFDLEITDLTGKGVLSIFDVQSGQPYGQTLKSGVYLITILRNGKIVESQFFSKLQAQ